ncbi:MAG TPA: hypothetical protein VGQ58_00975 [Candidatus Limnocylindrales bacterium]|jgi:hypothetical protein|nr:hypothetical protein [Candidatus Limnocylindrales bacterium]
MVNEPARDEAAASPTQALPKGQGISEDWAATVVGLVLVVLVLVGIIGKGLVP